jgi:tetratricopeptide (TPR) repeat protein
MRIRNGLGARRSGPVCSALGMTLVFLVILECAGSAGGQEVDSWHGKEVVLESPETELIVGSEVVATGRYHRVFQVKRVKGNWLLLVSGTVSGWVDRDEVISFDQAIEECNRAIEDGSNLGLAYAKRGNLWFDTQDWEHALADFNEALQRDPKNTVLWRNRGLVWSRLKDENQAIADYSAAIQLDPNHGDAFESRGRSWTNLGDYDRAIADYSEALRLNPNDAMALEGRGLALLNKQEYDLVIADMTEALRLNPRLARAYSCRGAALASKKEYERALADFDEAIQRDPNDVEAYGGEATIWATCPVGRYRDGRKAVASATIACKLHEWTCANCLDTLAAAHAETGKFDEAIKWQKKALEILPGDNRDRESFRARLALYQARKPCRGESSGPDNALAVSPPPRNSGDRSRPNETRGSSSASTR